MMDLYLISDSIDNPKSPEKDTVKYIDGVKDIEFDELKRFKLIEDKLDFYTDFRWKYSEVELKIKSAKANLSQSATLSKFLSILEQAAINKQGIIGFCD